MKRFLIPGLLVSAGLVLSWIGALVLLTPHTFFATNGITLGHDPSLMSEIRAPGGLLLASGVVVLLGALRRAMRREALMLAALVYGSFGASRLLAITLDGVPTESLLGAMGVELVLAAACGASLWWAQPTAPETERLPDPHRQQRAADGIEAMGLEVAPH